MSGPVTRRARYAALIALAVAAGTYQACDSWAPIHAMLHARDEIDTPLTVAPVSPVIRTVGHAAAEAGVKPGDRLVAVAGNPYIGSHVLGRALASARPGDRLHLTIDRPLPDGRTERHETVIRLAPGSSKPYSAKMYFLVIVLGVITPAFCLLLGFGVAAIRPFDPLAWLLLLLMLSFSQIVDFGTQYAGWPDWLRAPAVAYHSWFNGTWANWMLLFGLYFPTRLPLDRRHPWMKWLLIVPLGFGPLAGTVRDVGAVERFASVESLDRLLGRLGAIPALLGFAAIGVFFTCIGYRHGSEKAPDARRRLRLLEVGSEISLGPIGVLLIGSLILHRDFSRIPWALVYPSLALMALFPLTLAYVIVVQRALDLRVVVRQSLQYALARNGIRTMQILVSVALTFVTVTLISAPTTDRGRKIAYIGLGIVFVAAARRGGDRLRAWTDRKFFREAYSAEQILNDLADEVRTILETGPLLVTVARRVADSLHVRKIAAMLEQHGTYVPAHSIGFEREPEVRVASRGRLAERLLAERKPLPIYLDDPQAWVNNDGLSNEERSAVLALDSELLLPLAVREDLLGFMSLGPKQSEAAYSPSDLRLLQSVATQTGLALQNSRLTTAMAAEVARRERQNREIEIAREVQEGLFPQKRPAVPGLDYAGHCRPALGVGGDYYDFLGLPGGQFAVAIGDVSGKGIPAALLMASLQASLRAQTIGGAIDLAALVTNLNHLIFDASPPNRYATFFYGQYDPTTRRLDYVNAGHNPPMVFRRHGSRLSPQGETGQVLRLENGGPVIGLLEIARFETASIALEPGDLLVAYTDGISEAMNAADEEWGEERLNDAIARCDTLPAGQVIQHLMREADAFVGGAPQHDDMTLIVLRVQESKTAPPI